MPLLPSVALGLLCDEDEVESFLRFTDGVANAVEAGAFFAHLAQTIAASVIL